MSKVTIEFIDEKDKREQVYTISKQFISHTKLMSLVDNVCFLWYNQENIVYFEEHTENSMKIWFEDENYIGYEEYEQLKSKGYDFNYCDGYNSFELMLTTLGCSIKYVAPAKTDLTEYW